MAIERQSRGCSIRLVQQVLLGLLQPESRFIAHFWVVEIKGVKGLDDGGCHHDSAEPLVVCGHHIPGANLGCGILNCALIGFQVVVPECTFVDVIRREFPVLPGVFKALQETFLLLLPGHMQKNFRITTPLLVRY